MFRFFNSGLKASEFVATLKPRSGATAERRGLRGSEHFRELLGMSKGFRYVLVLVSRYALNCKELTANV